MDVLSLEYLILLISTFFLYYLINFINKQCKRIIIPQWSVLLIASIVFYGFTNYVFLIYLISSSLLSYVVALLCQHRIFKKDVAVDTNKRRKYEKALTIFVIVVIVGILSVLKYYNFFVTSTNSLFKTSFITYKFIIPLGISFYTFSLISYNVDCYKKITIAEKNPFKFLLFVSYFPKVLQGPISSYDKLKEDGLFNNHSFANNNYLPCFFRISIGLVKKIIIANIFGLYVDGAYQNLLEMHGLVLLITSIFYSIQLYCDFSGFMDITIGISGLFGIKLEENFKTPYLSSSIHDFWRRWHVTLGAWLKKYIYIPLGGSRVPTWKWVINIMIVWIISGLWHGANWTFVIWGIYHGILLIVFGLKARISKNEKENPKKETRMHIVLSTLLTFFLVNFGWILFRSENIVIAARFFKRMLEVWKPTNYAMFFNPLEVKTHWLLIISITLTLILALSKIFIKSKDDLFAKFKNPKLISTICIYSITIVFFSISIFSFLYLSSIGGGQSSFIYFDF
ncbi:MAG: MBOAT family protein [Bacilli bacterium]|nr:MBOAT family protein [Bacilli bacterium]